MTRKPEETLEYLGGIKKLSAAELSVMKIIWKYPEGISSDKIYESCLGPRGTISTNLYKISEKGYAKKIQNGRHHLYTALVSQAEYEQALLRQKLKKTMGFNSLEHLIAAFCGIEDLNKEQLDKTKKLLEELKDDMDNKSK